ncbi:unnamed protein product, partial [marine sediment metagenome]
MSRLFDDGSSEYLGIDQTALAGRPVAMVCRFNTNDAAATQSLMILCDKDSLPNYRRLYIHGDNDIVAYEYGQTSASGATEATGFAVDTWHHACAIYATSTDRRMILNGSLKATDNTEVGVVDSLDRMTLGAYRIGAVNVNYLSG